MPNTVASQTNSTTVTATLTDWWLKDAVHLTDMVRMLITSGPEVQKSERIGIHEPLGGGPAVVISDGLGADRITMTVLTRSRANYQQFLTLQRRGVPLLLQSPQGDSWYVRFALPPYWTPVAVNTAVRNVRLSFIEVQKPV